MTTTKKRNWIESTDMHSLKNAVLSHLEENPTKYGSPTSTIASALGARYGRDGDKARSRVGYALRKLAETPDVERCDMSANKARYRFVSFEERKKRADKETKRANDKGMAEVMVRLMEGNNVKAVVSERRFNEVKVSVDPHDLYNFLRSKGLCPVLDDSMLEGLKGKIVKS